MYTCIIPASLELNIRSTHARTFFRCIPTYKPTNKPIQMHTHTYIYMQTYIYMHMHYMCIIRTNTVNACTRHTHTRPLYTHTLPYLQTYTNAHTYIYTHIYIHICIIYVFFGPHSRSTLARILHRAPPLRRGDPRR